VEKGRRKRKGNAYFRGGGWNGRPLEAVKSKNEKSAIPEKNDGGLGTQTHGGRAGARGGRKQSKKKTLCGTKKKAELTRSADCVQTEKKQVRKSLPTETLDLWRHRTG